MCVAVITCHESDFYLIRATASTKNVLRAEALFFGCFHNSFIVFTARGLYDGVTCLFSPRVALSRRTGTSVQMFSQVCFQVQFESFLYSLCLAFDGQFMRSSWKHRKSRWMISTKSLKLERYLRPETIGTWQPKKCIEEGEIPLGTILKVQEFNCFYYSIPG